MKGISGEDRELPKGGLLTLGDFWFLGHFSFYLGRTCDE
jgi:hypothetical protein